MSTTTAVAGPTVDLTRPFPVVGRAAQLTAIAESLTAPGTKAVVLGGPAGVGKSRLLAEALAGAAERDLEVATVTASRAASSIPFGALAPLLPVDDLLADSVVGLVQRAAKTIAELGAGRPVVLGIDDAHLLDDASATLVHQLATEGGVHLLLAIRSGERLSAALASVVGDTATRKMNVGELRRREVEQLTISVLGGDVDGAVTQALWNGSRGNPLYLRELLAASVDAGTIALDRGVWRLTSTPTVPPRLVELIEARLATVTEQERAALETVAIANGIGRTMLEDLVGTDVVSGLVSRGLVTTARDARRQPLRLQHPLYEETLRRGLTSRRLRATQLRVAELMEAVGLRRRDDRLFCTTLRLDAGADLDVGMIEAAALDAYFAFDLTLTERLCRAGVAAGAGPRLRRLLAEILRWQGRHDETEAMLAEASLDSSDERERALTTLVRAENLFRGLGRHDDAVHVLRRGRDVVRDPAWIDEIDAMEAVFAAFAGDVVGAVDAARPILERGPSRAMTRAATATAISLTFAGRADDAARIADEAFAAASVLGPQENQAIIATHVIQRCLALAESGRLGESEQVGRISYSWALAANHAIGHGWFALLLGRSAQIAGRLDEASRRFRESALVFRDLRDHGIRRTALAGLAQTTAALGRVTDASAALDEIDTAPPVAVHLLEAEVMRARAWVAVARRALADARRILLDAAAWAHERGQHGLELSMLHDLVRLGDTHIAAERAAALASTVQGPLAEARRLHATAALTRDGVALDAASAAFAAIGASLYAAEAAADAAAAHHRAGRAAAARASVANRDLLATQCEGASTPALSNGDGETVRLTARELELATLAATGMASADIASRLGISVRTVNNLLQRAYVKLGVSGRRELAARLETY